MTELMRRRRALMAEKSETQILNPTVGYTEDKKIDRAAPKPYIADKTGCAATDFIDAGTAGNFVYFNPNTPDLLDISTGQTCGSVLLYSNNKESSPYSDWWSCNITGIEKTIGLAENKRYVRLNLPIENLSGVYAYNSASGQVYYAGKDSPYYGKVNIND